MLVLESEGLLGVVAVLLCGADNVLELALGNAGLLFDVLEGVAAVTEGHRLSACCDRELGFVFLALRHLAGDLMMLSSMSENEDEMKKSA